VSDLFKKPEYPEIDAYKEKEAAPSPENTFKSDITEELGQVRGIFGAVTTGQSTIVPVPLQLNEKSPCFGALQKLDHTRTKENLRNLIRVVKQDINTRAAQEVAKIFKRVDKEAESYVDQ
jgi:hypothetical protein